MAWEMIEEARRRNMVIKKAYNTGTRWFGLILCGVASFALTGFITSVFPSTTWTILIEMAMSLIFYFIFVYKHFYEFAERKLKEKQ